MTLKIAIIGQSPFGESVAKRIQEIQNTEIVCIIPPFNNKEDFLLRWDNINKKIQDGIQGIEFVLEGRRVPENLRTTSSMSTDDLAGRRANLLKIVQGDG